jgi:hypothetical protein
MLSATVRYLYIIMHAVSINNILVLHNTGTVQHCFYSYRPVSIYQHHTAVSTHTHQPHSTDRTQHDKSLRRASKNLSYTKHNKGR